MPASYTLPAAVPTWNTSGSNRSTPSGGKISSGWVYDEYPSSAFFNYLMHYTGAWLEWLNERVADADAGNSLSLLSPNTGTEALRINDDDGVNVMKGLCVGFDGTNVQDLLQIGDAEFRFDLSGSNPLIVFQTTGGNDYLEYDRSGSAFNFYVAGTVAAQIDADQIICVDSAFYMQFNGTDGFLNFDSTDYMTYVRSTDQFEWYVGGSRALMVDDAYVVFQDSAFLTWFDGTDPYIQFDSNDYLKFDRDGGESNTNGALELYINSTRFFQIQYDETTVPVVRLGENGSHQTHIIQAGGGYHVFESNSTTLDLTGWTVFPSAANSNTANGFIRKLTDTSGESGGLTVCGIADAGDVNGLQISGVASGEDTTHTSSSEATIHLKASDHNGSTNLAAHSDDANIFGVSNNGTMRLILEGNGDLHVTNTTLVALDTERDAVACRDAMYALGDHPEKVIAYNREKLEEIGVLTPGGQFIRQQAMMGLLMGGIGEMYHVMERVLDKMGLDYETLRREIRAEIWKEEGTPG